MHNGEFEHFRWDHLPIGAINTTGLLSAREPWWTSEPFLEEIDPRGVIIPNERNKVFYIIFQPGALNTIETISQMCIDPFGDQ